MNISRFRYFIEVCRTKNITKAAKNLFVSQPSITSAIKKIEEELGVNLFIREKQRVNLTKEGIYFYKEIEKIVNNLDDLVNVMKDFGQKQRSVKVGVPPMTASFILPEIFLGFQKEHPEVNLEIYEHGALESRELLKAEKLDLAVIIGDDDIKTNKNSFKLNRKTFFKLFVNEGHKFTQKESISFKDIAEEPLILFNSGFYINKFVMKKFEELGVRSPNIILKTGQVNTVKRFISEGLAIGFLIEDSVQASDKLVEVSFEVEIPIKIGVEWKEKEYPADHALKLMNYIIDHKK